MKILLYILLIMSCISCTGKKDSQLKSQEVNTSLQSNTDYTSYVGNDFHMDDQHSYIGFKIKYFGYSPVRGRFNEFDGTLFYNPKDISGMRVSVFIDANSINTGNERRDNDLKKEGSWFDAEKFPTIHFNSNSVISKSDGGFDLIGELTIKDTSKLDTISFDKPTNISKDWAGNEQVDFSGKIIIDRQDFGIFGGDFWSQVMENGITQLSDKVEIELDIHTRRFDYQARYDSADSTDIIKKVLDHIKDNGIEEGLKYITDLHEQQKLSSGKFSSIGYTLNLWKMHEEALAVFEKRLAFFPEKRTTWNQLGITNLLLSKNDEALRNFEKSLEANSNDSRASAYIRLLDSL